MTLSRILLLLVFFFLASSSYSACESSSPTHPFLHSGRTRGRGETQKDHHADDEDVIVVEANDDGVSQTLNTLSFTLSFFSLSFHSFSSVSLLMLH